MYFVNITDIAEEDILNTGNYISKVLMNPIAANNLLDKIEACRDKLEDEPHLFTYVPDEYLKSKRIKYTMINNFMLFFRIRENEDVVDVIRFLYGRRDWQNILKNDARINDEEENNGSGPDFA
jgi:plasmid stabilization system protein ParE